MKTEPVSQEALRVAERLLALTQEDLATLVRLSLSQIHATSAASFERCESLLEALRAARLRVVCPHDLSQLLLDIGVVMGGELLRQRSKTQPLPEADRGVSCDWGECEAEATCLRLTTAHGWLPCCARCQDRPEPT